MVVLFTFGSGTLGELGTGRLDDTKRIQAVAVEFPQSAPRNVDSELAIEAVALGTDHSLALIGNHVYRWGLLGANVETHQRRAANACQPEVVREPVSISELVPFAGKDSAQNNDGSLSSPDGFVSSITCGGSNSFMVNFHGEVFLLGSLKTRSGNPDCLRHIWGNPRGDASCRVAKVAAGWRHCIMLTEAGNVFALGDDEHGQCAGVGTGFVAVSLPRGQPIVGVSAGACHSVAWDHNGSVFSWGHGGSGRLGVGGTRNRRAPARVEMIQDRVVSARCGANFTVFVSSSGRSLWACGGNQYGQLGVGGENRTACEVPVPLGFPQNGQEVVSLECGANHVLCLTHCEGMYERLVAWAWGCASSGQCGRMEDDGTSKVFPVSRSTPGALIDFLPPSPHWPLAISAGRSHSAILAQVGSSTDARHSDDTNFIKSDYVQYSELHTIGRSGRKLPDVPQECDVMLDGSELKPSCAPNHLWNFPEGHSISHIHGMNGVETTMSPLRVASRSPPLQTVLDPNTTAEDDIIDMFCAGLSVANRSPSRLPSPPERSVSPVNELVKFGEAALHQDTTYTTASAILEQQPSSENEKGSKTQLVAHSSVRRSVVTSARRTSTKIARSSTPQRCVNTSWPQPPSSWATSGRRRSASQQTRPQQRRRPSQSPSLERTQPSVVTPPSQPTSMWEAHPGPYLTGISTLSTTLDGGSPNLVDASPKLPAAPTHVEQSGGVQVPNMAPFAARDYGVAPPQLVARGEDEWTGVHASLQGLSNMIANIGGPTVSTQSHPAVARDVATGNAFYKGHASPDRNANMTGFYLGSNVASPPRRVQGVVLPSSPASLPHDVVANTSVTSRNLSPSGHWPTSPQRPFEYAPPMTEAWDVGSPRECGSGSETHLDFSPRSTGSSPPQRVPVRRRLSNTPVRRRPVAVLPYNPRVEMVTDPFSTVPTSERSMFVLNSVSQVPLSPCSEEHFSSKTRDLAVKSRNNSDDSVRAEGGDKRDPPIQEVTRNVPEVAEPIEHREPERPMELISSSRGASPMMLEAIGSSSDMADSYYPSKRSPTLGGLEIPPPSLPRRASADSADITSSVVKVSPRRDSDVSKNSVRRSNASSLASEANAKTNMPGPLADGLRIPKSQGREGRDSVEGLQIPAFGAQPSSGASESDSTDEEEKSEDDSTSSGSNTPAAKPSVVTTGKALGGIVSEDDSDSGSASDSSAESSSSEDNTKKETQEARKIVASTSSDWV